MTPLVIYGASFGAILKTIARINRQHPTFTPIGFIDDSMDAGRPIDGDLVVLGGSAALAALIRDGVAVFHNARGSAAAARTVWGKIAAAGGLSCSLVDPDADLTGVTHGPGLSAANGVALAASIRLGACCTLRLGAVVSHDVSIGDHVLIGPGAVVGSHVEIGEDCEVGAGAVIAGRVRIGSGARIGAGALVLRDVPVGARIVASPGRRAPGIGR